MPYVPRRTPPMGSLPPELLGPARPHAPVPVRQPQPADLTEGRRQTIGLQRISPRTHKIDQQKFLKTFFGKEPDVDPYTGQLVPASLGQRGGVTAQWSGG